MEYKKVGIYVAVAVIFLGAVLLINLQGTALDVVEVTTGPITEYVEETATVKSRYSRTVYFESTGRVSEVLVEKGDFVQSGALLLKLDPTDQQITETATEQAKNNYKQSLKDWEKVQKLYVAGVINRKEYDEAETTYKNATSAYRSAVLELGKVSRSVQLRAPCAGVILDKFAEPNLYAATGIAALIIGDPTDLEIEAEILADDVVNIRPGNQVIIIGGSLGGDQSLNGQVIKVAPMAKNVTSSLGVNQKRCTVTIELTNGCGQLKPGVDVDVRIITKNIPMSLKAPLGAIFNYKERTCVFLVENGHAKLRKIIKGIENEEAVEIKAGLKSGQLILSKPDNTVKEGMKIKIPAGLKTRNGRK